MTHRFPVKEIARQSGLSTATIDRVLNNRAHVSPQTRQRVEDAIGELLAQEKQLAARGRSLFIDIVVEAPLRFSREIKKASEAVLTDFLPIALRPRFQLFETITPADCADVLKRIAKRGSQGVCLKVRDTRIVREAIETLTARGIPVVTLFTDVAQSSRLAYVGIDNKIAGKTAAFLMNRFLGIQDRTVLVTLSRHSFQGEEDRFLGFKEDLLRDRPDINLIDASGGGGLTTQTSRDVAEKIRSISNLAAVYSMGGGNSAILKELRTTGLEPRLFIAHDLDEDNLELLREGLITFALSHDLRDDMRTAFRYIRAHHGTGDTPTHPQSEIRIITPANLPRVAE